MMRGREAISQVLIYMVCVEVILQKSRLTFSRLRLIPEWIWLRKSLCMVTWRRSRVSQILSLLIINLTTLRFRYFWDAHLEWNPEDPNAAYEFQGGAIDGWWVIYSRFMVLQTHQIWGVALGMTSVQSSLVLNSRGVNSYFHIEFMFLKYVVFYKNQYALSTMILNLYMTFGGTNWGA